MRIGTMFLGKVDAIGHESVQTKFLIIGLPLVPLSSSYVLEERVNGVRGFEIPVHGKSVLFGYLRMYAWIGALLCGVFALIERHDPEGLWVWCGILGAVAAVTTFALGGLSKHEKLRRSLLLLTTGVGAPPDMLPADVRGSIGTKLNLAWEKENEGKPWRAAVEGGAAEPVLFALAEYEGDRGLAEAVLSRLGDAKKGSQGPYR
jgi:hypothetical protein